jgi:hypothetical protein
MSKRHPKDEFFERLAALEDHGPASSEIRAPARLKSRIYSALVRKQQQSGPIASVSESHASGYGLCVFEQLHRIAPVGEAAKQFNGCAVCHARKLAESFEKAPIWWGNCPYVEFQNR